MKYRIVKSYWVGRSGKVYDEYLVQTKGWFWWNNSTDNGFESIEAAEKFVEKHKTNYLVVKELE